MVTPIELIFTLTELFFNPAELGPDIVAGFQLIRG